VMDVFSTGCQELCTITTLFCYTKLCQQ